MPLSVQKKKDSSLPQSHWKKKVVLDTNVILFDGLALLKFEKSDIHIPFSVIEEIDRFKRDLGETGRNARQFSRFLDILREKGSLASGVPVKTGSFVYVSTDHFTSSLSSEINPDKADNRILALCLYLQENHRNSEVLLISKDINLRIKADVLGLHASDFDPEGPSFEDLYAGYTECSITKEQFEEFQLKKSLRLEKKLLPNQYVYLKNQDDKATFAMARYFSQQDKVLPLKNSDKSVWGVYPRNLEQSFALDALLDDTIGFVSLIGKAGTGKTLLALAVGLHKTLDEANFKRLLVSRPIFPMGRDIGYLPGDIEQKLNPWMQPIFDNVEFLLGSDKKASGQVQELINQGMLNIEPLTYIRGRSIPNQFLIIDEAQNLTPHEIKTIITRAGDGTKIILTGDPYQIDNPYIDSANSGLSYSVERFKSYNISAHVSLRQGERSELAELAANIL